MKRRMFLTVAAAALVTAGQARAERLLVNSPGDGFLNLRTGPGSQFDIIRKMFHGSAVETLEFANGWVRVRHESGAVGWAFAKYLVRPAATNVRYVYSANDGFLNLRTGPGTRYQIIRPMYNGEAVTLLERSGGWVRVKHESGAIGWTFEKYLRR